MRTATSTKRMIAGIGVVGFDRRQILGRLRYCRSAGSECSAWS